MASPFEPVPKVSVVDHIVDQIKSLMRDHRYRPGSKLPTERDLAKQLGVSRPTVREALRTLEHMGVLDKHPGSGTQIAGSGKGILDAPFEFLFMLDQPTLWELNEARTGFEVYVAGLAAERRTPEDLAAIEAALREYKDTVSPEANIRFHQSVAAAAHNRILERIMSSLHEGIRTSIRTLQTVVDDRERSYKVHEEVYLAIRKGDPEEARRAMSRHMELNREHLGSLGPARRPDASP